MRYLIAMITAVILALIATLFISGGVANWVVGRMTFDNPDQVADLHSLVFMGTNIAALLLGWVIGWAIGKGAVNDGTSSNRPG